MQRSVKIEKKQKIIQAKTIKKVFYIIFILFVIAGSIIFKDALNIKDSSSITLLVFSLIFLIVLLTIFMILNNLLKSTIKSIEINPNNITFVFMDDARFTLDKSNIHSLVAEEHQLGDYRSTQFYILIKQLPVNNQLYATKRHQALLDNNNLSFTSADLKDNNLDVEFVDEYLKINYNGWYSSKKMFA